MSFRIVRTAIAAERESTLHEARLLLLLAGCGLRGDGAIEGFTKLAKLDFFLRYPVYLERVVRKLRRRPPVVSLQPPERDTGEGREISDWSPSRGCGTRASRIGVASSAVTGARTSSRSDSSSSTDPDVTPDTGPEDDGTNSDSSA